jgi:hypothetical protein
MSERLWGNTEEFGQASNYVVSQSRISLSLPREVGGTGKDQVRRDDHHCLEQHLFL